MKDAAARDRAFAALIAVCEERIGFAGMDRLSEAQIFAAGWSAHEQYIERLFGLPPSDRTVEPGTPYPWTRSRQER